jgi:hypothetical protein
MFRPGSLSRVEQAVAARVDQRRGTTCLIAQATSIDAILITIALAFVSALQETMFYPHEAEPLDTHSLAQVALVQQAKRAGETEIPA